MQDILSRHSLLEVWLVSAGNRRVLVWKNITYATKSIYTYLEVLLQLSVLETGTEFITEPSASLGSK